MNKPTQAAATARLGGGSYLRRWLRGHRWGCGHSVRRLLQRPLASAFTMLVMGFALALPLVFALLLTNLQGLSRTLGTEQEISIFLQPNRSAVFAKSMATTLQQRGSVAQVVLRSPPQGRHELATIQGFKQALASLPDNPLPWVLEVQPRPGLQRGQIETLVNVLRGMDGVLQVQDQRVLRARLETISMLGGRVLILLGGLLTLSALLVVGGSVRADILQRSEEIIVLNRVGASHAFVRRPYLYAGSFLGFGSGVLAVVLVLALELALATPVAQMTAAWGGHIALHALPASWLFVVPALAAMLGWLGARLASARHLALLEPT